MAMRLMTRVIFCSKTGRGTSVAPVAASDYDLAQDFVWWCKTRRKSRGLATVSVALSAGKRSTRCAVPTANTSPGGSWLSLSLCLKSSEIEPVRNGQIILRS